MYNPLGLRNSYNNVMMMKSHTLNIKRLTSLIIYHTGARTRSWYNSCTKQSLSKIILAQPCFNMNEREGEREKGREYEREGTLLAKNNRLRLRDRFRVT